MGDARGGSPAGHGQPAALLGPKRAIDVSVSGVLIIMILPALALIALAIVLDSRGSPLFCQTRVGLRGKQFDMFKFRTMIPERRVQNRPLPLGQPERRRVHKSHHDPRVTRVGRVLRRTCIDELPQLVNVLRGDMSLVGPRPELPMIVARYEPWQHERHQVMPGITGWWQVNRDDRLMHEATELDVYYVAHQSLWLDLVILVKTAKVVLRGFGAF